MGASASAVLSSTVAGFIHGEGLPFSLVDSDLFAQVIVAARNAPSSYKLPERHEIAGIYPDKNASLFISKGDSLIASLASRFGTRARIRIRAVQ